MLAPLSVTFRLAFRDLRAGLGGFRIAIACIALGVAAIVGVDSLAQSLGEGLAREGRAILGGDASFALMGGDLSADERAWLGARGRLDTIETLRAMARAARGDAALVEVKAVDDAWPLIGTAEFAPPMTAADALGLKDGAWGLAVEDGLLARLDLHVGDRLTIGSQNFDIRTLVKSEPDRLAVGIGFGPRALMTAEALRATGLVQPGSLIRFTTRLILPARTSGASVDQLIKDADAAFPEAGWEARGRANASPGLTKNLDRFGEFLALIGLTSLIVGGVGVANAAQAFVDRKQATLATMKSLGATGRRVVALALIEFMGVALIGVAIGVVVGAALPFVVDATLSAIVPFPLAPSVFPMQIGLGLLYGILTALVFSIIPLSRAHDLPVSALFRDHVNPERAWPRVSYLAMTALVGLALAGLAIVASADRRLALIVVVATMVAFVALRLVAAGLMALARRSPRPNGVEWRLALANIHRPGALTPSVVLSLGLGLAVLVALTMIDGVLHNALHHTLPGETPSFYFVDVRGADLEKFRAFLHDEAPEAKIVEAPMMRGRIVKVGAVRAEDAKVKDSAAWVLEGDRGLTYDDAPPEGSKVVSGAWWPKDYAGPPLVSIDSEVAEGLGLRIGDTITVNILGRNVVASIANLRKVNWRSFGISFVLVYSPNTFNGAPHTFLVSAAWPNAAPPTAEASLLRDTARAFPSVAAVRVRDALEAIDDLIDRLAIAIRAASAVALSTSVLVLAGALAADQRARIYDAVVLKVLGATRGRLLAAFLIEYAALGATTALFGLAAGGAAAWFVVVRVMDLDFDVPPGPPIAAAILALVATVALGLAGSWRVLGQKPAAVLRGL